MTAVVKITVVAEISSCTLFGSAGRIPVGEVITVTPFDEGRFGTLYRYENPRSITCLVIKLLHAGDDCRSIVDLHRAIAQRAGDFAAGWEALLRGMPFWVGKVKFGKEETIALISMDLDMLGFVQLHRLLEQDWQTYFALDLRRRVRLAASFACSYAILEELRFLHADINSENLFVNLQTAEALLIDFDAGVLRLRGDEIPKSPGKPNEFLPLELKSATGADVMKFNEAAERWSVGFMVSTLIFGIHPLFFLSHLSQSVVEKYLARHQWPEIDLHSKISYVWYSPTKQKQKAVRNYLHFVRHDLGSLEKLRPKGFSLMQRFINDGALHPEKRPSAKEWITALVEEPRSMTDPTLYCSFCGKSQKEVGLLIESQNVSICDACINLCTDILQEKLSKETKKEKYKLAYKSDFLKTDKQWPEDVLYAGDIKAFRRDGFYHLALQRPYGIGRFYYQWLGEPYVEDGKIAVEAGFTPGFTARTADDAFYGILFRWSRDFHYVFCVSRQGKYWLFRYSDGENTVVINWVPCNQINREAGLNTLEVNFGSTDICTAITMRVNGKDIATLVDDTPGLASGLVGVCVGSLVANGQPEARFRNFQVFAAE